MHLLRNFLLVKVFVLCFSNHRSTEAYSLVGSGWCLTYAQRGPPAIFRNREEFDQYYCKQFANTKTTLECLEDLCNELSDCIAIDWKSNENVHLRFRSEESVINVCGDSPAEVYACRNFQTITNYGQGWQVWRGSEACKTNCDVTSSGGTWDGRQASGECFVKNDENLVREKIGCRSDICTDYFNDCCAPGDEPRGCSMPGYTVSEGVTSSSWCWGGAYQCCPSSEIISSGITCRSDICTDIGNDCCAPWGEARGCSMPGYTVSEGTSSSWCWGGAYQCCTSAGITSHGLHSIIFVGMVAFMLI